MKLAYTRATALILCLCLVLFVVPAGAAAADIDAGVSFIQLGEKGNATLIKSEDGSTTVYGLVDAGSVQAYVNYVQPYLAEQLGTAKLSFIALSHLDIDHTGGILQAIDDFADENTTLYLKDAVTDNAFRPSEQKMYTRCLGIKNAAKTLGMPIVKISPVAKISGDINEVADILKQNDNVFKAKLVKYAPRVDGEYAQSGAPYDSVTFGRYVMTWFNGNDWNNEPYVMASENMTWNDNANVSPLLLNCTTSTGEVFRTLLNSDLGENSKAYYCANIANRVAALVGAVDVYQVAHHGYYFSILPDKTMAILSPKYAIVTNSYNTIVNTYYKNKGVSDPTDTDLSNANSTIKEVCKSKSLVKVYYLDGMGAVPDNRIINALAANDYALLNMEDGVIKAGTVSFTFAGDNLSVTQ